MTVGASLDQRIGMWSALAVFLLGVAYVITGAIWLVTETDPAIRERFSPGDPYRAILEALIVLAAPLMVVMMASVHARTPRGKRTCSLAALIFMSLVAGVTCSVHFVQLTVVRRIEPAAMWTSVAFALDLLAWDLFLGLSLLFAAPVFRGGGLEGSVRTGMILSGTLCIAGILGPTLGDLRFQSLGIIGYACVFPVVCLLLAMLLRRAD